MKTKDLKEVINKLADSDPEGIGLVRQQLGDDEWQRCASHAAGFLGAWLLDRVEEEVAPERQLADALAEQLRNHGPHNGYARDVLARHKNTRSRT